MFAIKIQFPSEEKALLRGEFPEMGEIFYKCANAPLEYISGFNNEKIDIMIKYYLLKKKIKIIFIFL